MKFPNFLKSLSPGSDRDEFAVCPRENHYPKCEHCNVQLIQGDCPLGRTLTSYRITQRFREGCLQFSSSDCEELTQDEALFIASIEKGETARPRSQNTETRLLGRGKPSYRRGKEL